MGFVHGFLEVVEARGDWASTVTRLVSGVVGLDFGIMLVHVLFMCCGKVIFVSLENGGGGASPGSTRRRFPLSDGTRSFQSSSRSRVMNGSNRNTIGGI